MTMQRITADQAKAAVGTEAFESAKAASVPTRTELFRREGNKDMAAHPLRYATALAGVWAYSISAIPEAIHGALAIIDIFHSAHELSQGSR